MHHHCPEVPFILVGMKIDLRTDPPTVEKLAAKRQQPITREEGQRLAEEIGAHGFCEISSITRENLSFVSCSSLLFCSTVVLVLTSFSRYMRCLRRVSGLLFLSNAWQSVDLAFRAPFELALKASYVTRAPRPPQRGLEPVPPGFTSTSTFAAGILLIFKISLCLSVRPELLLRLYALNSEEEFQRSRRHITTSMRSLI